MTKLEWTGTQVDREHVRTLAAWVAIALPFEDNCEMNDPVVVNNGSDGQPKSVAFIITHTVKAGEEQRYESWLADVFQASSA